MTNAALLGLYIYAGRRSLASGTTCIATGVAMARSGSDLDYVGYTPATNNPTFPRLICITGATVLLDAGSATDGYIFAASAHTLIS